MHDPSFEANVTVSRCLSYMTERNGRETAQEENYVPGIREIYLQHRRKLLLGPRTSET